MCPTAVASSPGDGAGPAEAGHGFFEIALEVAQVAQVAAARPYVAATGAEPSTWWTAATILSSFGRMYSSIGRL
jgi:hypothetical protein